MWLRSVALRPALRPWWLGRPQWRARRRLMTLAIETSCDDTSVAVVEKGVQDDSTVARLHFHKKITSNNSAYQGVHPLASLESHQENLAKLVNQAIEQLPLSDWGREVEDDACQKEELGTAADIATKRLPDVISVTRGPGMRSNLFTGLDTAKGLAAAWQKPLIGVHHMQAHALTPRLISALEAYAPPYDNTSPLEGTAGSSSLEFPFLSLLASGGHTLLIHSTSLTDHHVLGSTSDIAIGECLDKVARVILPAEILQATKSTMYGSLLENFAFGEVWREDQRRQAEMQTLSPLEEAKQPDEEENASSWLSALFSSVSVSRIDPHSFSVEMYLEKHGHRYLWYHVPSNYEEATRKSTTKWGWGFNQPLIKAGGGTKINSFEMSFSGLMTAVERVVHYGMDPTTRKLHRIERAADEVSIEERKDIAREAMRAAFEHVASRVLLGLQSLNQVSMVKPAVVMAGGVAANSFLRHILASTLHANGYGDAKLHFPPAEYCTDNAAMIGWAGLEMFEAGHTDPLSVRAIRKWPLDKLLDAPNDG